MGLRHVFFLCEVLEGLADPHAGPVESPSQGDENQEQQHGPRGVDPLVGLSLRPRSSLKRERERKKEIRCCFLKKENYTSRVRYVDYNEPALGPIRLNAKNQRAKATIRLEKVL